MPWKWNRRDFLRTSTFAVAGGAVPWWRVPAADRRRDGFTELRRGVGIFTGRGGTIGWLISPDGVVVVDSQFPDSAGVFVEGLKNRTMLPVAALINSHHHLDHTGGNGVIRPLARSIVAHARVPELQRVYEADRGEQTYADITFEREWSLDVGQETVRARHYGPAHTGGDCTITFENAGIVHMGDLMFNRVHPFIDRPAGASIRGWIDLLETVMRDNATETLYVFGHGRPEFGVTGGRTELEVQRDFLGALLETTQRAIADGRSADEIAELPPPAAFPDHQGPPQRIAANYRVAYEELTAT